MFQRGEITLRTIESRDLDSLRALRNNPTTWMNLTDPVLIDAKSQEKWFQSLQGRSDRQYFSVALAERDFIGLVRMDEMDRQNRSIRVGCDIVPELRGQGYGTKVFEAILCYCFDFLNFHRVWLCVLETNQNAAGLYKKSGFKEEGRYRDAIFREGKYHDYIVMSILEPEYRKGDKK
jgi:UDP-4-amino-4,6-dideoxy-N-acetyl-beta-L-altrosamine N-acetyltransferase